MKSYKVVLFDLDHTLWDYDRNSKETIGELHVHHQLESRNVPFNLFHDAFQRVNLSLWDQYDRGLIDRHVIRHERFRMVLTEVGSPDDALATQLSEHYFALSPTKKHLVINAIEVLEYLHPRYPLILVTNGFENMQTTKVESGGIRKYFKEVVTSERAGHKKPAKEIFDFALEQGNHKNHEAIMIGDNLLTDIAGANNAGIDTVFFNPKAEPHTSEVTHEITNLIALKDIL